MLTDKEERGDFFDDEQQAALDFAQQAATGSADVDQKLVDRLKKYYSEQQIVEIALIVCSALVTNTINNSLGIKMPPEMLAAINSND